MSNDQVQTEAVQRYRVYAPEKKVAELSDTLQIEEHYPAFSIVTAQEDAIAPLIGSYPVVPLPAPKSAPASSDVVGIASAIGERHRGPYTKVVRFRSSIRKEWIDDIEASDCLIYETLGSSTIVAQCPNKPSVAKVEALPDVELMTDYAPTIGLSEAFFEALTNSVEQEEVDKLIEQLELGELASNNGATLLPDVLVARFFIREDQQLALRRLPRHGISDITEQGETALLINLSEHKDPIGALTKILNRQGLRSIEEQSIVQFCNNLARFAIARKVLNGQPGPSLGLTGKGELIGVADSGLDTGNPATIHSDFAGRIRSIQSLPIDSRWSSQIKNPGSDDGPADRFDGHGTHVAGSILGNGARAAANNNVSEQIEGTAPEAELFFQSVDQEVQWTPQAIMSFLKAKQAVSNHGLFGLPLDLNELFQEAYDAGVRIHSNSWGAPVFGQYTEDSRNLDQFVWKNKDMLIVVAAGNEGEKTVPPGGPGSVTAPGTAKNCLTVGACENERQGGSFDQLAAFSGRGPCKNGLSLGKRRKPDLVAPGTWILSVRSSQIPADEDGWGEFAHAPDDYMFMGGNIDGDTFGCWLCGIGASASPTTWPEYSIGGSAKSCIDSFGTIYRGDLIQFDTLGG
ncbi:S8 family serine peptidase [Chloroflexi bacterium TSY]|nr:S8 family serine peptidase [Chloroflexi bacterium TSY]